MSLPTQLAAYNDCYDIWSEAARLQVGCRTYVGPEYAAAEYLRMRMHQARSLLRAQSRRAYDRTHPQHGQSEYDAYKVVIKQDADDHYWLYVELHGNWSAVSNIEPIPPSELAAVPPNIAAAIAPKPNLLQLEAPAHANPQDDLD